MEHGLALYDRQQHHALAFRYGGYDPGVACLTFGTLDLWYLGFPNQALQRLHALPGLARELSHPLSSAIGLSIAAWLHQLRREPDAVRTHAEAAVALCSEHGFAFFLAHTAVSLGWARGQLGEAAEGLVQLRDSIAAYQATRSELEQPYLLGRLGEACITAGDAKGGQDAVAEALGALQSFGMGYFYEAELYRLKGELLLPRDASSTAEAEHCFRTAIAIAQRQSAKSFELRAATSLARLLRDRGQRDEARARLAPIYSWFTEGFDTRDLIEAKALLEELV